jgi:3-oxoacyl-(acyl-carrier-protein) synthase
MNTIEPIVITGMGAVTPIGTGVSRFWEHCKQGRSGVKLIEAFPVPKGYSSIAGQVTDLERPLQVDPERWARLDRTTQFGLSAALEATASAGVGTIDIDPARIAVHVCTAIAQISSMEASFDAQTQHATRRLSPLAADPSAHELDKFLFNATARAIAAAVGADGPCSTIPTGCTGGLDAIGHAIDALRSGAADVCITGACEAPITPLVVAAFTKIGATSLRVSDPERASRPFDVHRDGFVLGEGGAMFVLETEEHARRRGAKMLARVSGFGSVNNCFHMTDIPEDGIRIARAAEIALHDAGISPDVIDSINAHGSSTPQNDIAETNAFFRLFGDRAARIPVTSIKSQVGHPLSASNAIEVVASVMSLLEGIVPPTINLESLDPRCPLDVVGNTARSVATRNILKTSSGFSGIHSALILRAVEEV